MKRIVLFTVLVSGSAFAMEKNQAAVAAIEKKDAGVSTGAEVKVTPPSSSSTTAAPNKKGCFSRAFAWCNGKTEKN